MVFQCERCGGDVGEEGCVGCRQVIPYYMCSHCHKPTFNPRYKSGLPCPNCGAQVIVHFQKSMRPQISHYLCQKCKTVVENPVFNRYSACEGCVPLCPDCRGYLATNDRLDYFQCVKCGKKRPKKQIQPMLKLELAERFQSSS